MARAIPVCAIIASRLACDFVSTASVTTTTSVVFSEDVASGPPLSRAFSMSGVNEGGSPRPPNSSSSSNGAAQNHGPSPTVTLPTALTTASAADHDAAFGLRRSGAEPALEIGGGRAEAGADAAQREIGARRARCGVAEIAIGREAAPCLVAAVEQIEADRARDDRNNRLADSQAPALFGKPGLHAARGVQPKRRAAGERDGVDRLDGAFGFEERASSRVPGPPPRTSIEATAGESKMIAVTPEASAASSAWPTRTPDMSVRRFFKAPIRQAASAGPLSTDIAAAWNASTAKRQPEHPGEFGFAIGLCQQQHAGIEAAMMDDGVLGIPDVYRVFSAGRRFSASSTSWRPFMGPGMITSVNSRSMAGARR